MVMFQCKACGHIWEEPLASVNQALCTACDNPETVEPLKFVECFQDGNSFYRARRATNMSSLMCEAPFKVYDNNLPLAILARDWFTLVYCQQHGIKPTWLEEK